MESLIRDLLKTSLGLLNVLAPIVGSSNFSCLRSSSNNGVKPENLETYSAPLFESRYGVAADAGCSLLYTPAAS